MADGVSVLSLAQRAVLTDSKRVAFAHDESASRLASGRRVSNASDNPVDYLQAKALADRVADLTEVKGEIGLGQSTLETTNVGLETVEQFSRQLKGIATAARSVQSDAEREAYAAQFNEIRSQIDNVVADSSFLGRNLLQSPRQQTVQVGLGESSTLTTQGSDVSAGGLSIGDANAAYNGFTSASDIDAAIADIDHAISNVRSVQSDYSSDIALLNIRDTYTDSISSTLQTGEGKLVNADLNEEAARQVSAQTRIQLSTSSQRLLAQGDKLVLNLFS